jgi:hypothetical protein
MGYFVHAEACWQLGHQFTTFCVIIIKYTALEFQNCLWCLCCSSAGLFVLCVIYNQVEGTTVEEPAS